MSEKYSLLLSDQLPFVCYLNQRDVTIWGQSAGAGCTMFHLMGNGGDNEGLFHQAMGDSPSLNFLPPYNNGAVETLYLQYAINAYVILFTVIRMSIPLIFITRIRQWMWRRE